MISRLTLPYSTSTEFQITDRSYSQQFAGFYFSRLAILRSKVLASAKKFLNLIVSDDETDDVIMKNGSSNNNKKDIKYVERMLDVLPGDSCFIVGTVYMDMVLKPNVLEEIGLEEWTIVPPPRTKYTSDTDTICLEDESGRLKLTGDILKSQFLVTGCVVGLIGREINGGQFYVEEIVYPEMSPQSDIGSSGGFIGIVSGINVDGEVGCSSEAYMMADFLSGELGNEEEVERISKICRLIVAGNSILPPKRIEDETSFTKKSKNSNFNTQGIQQLDQVIKQICTSLDLDIMPGANDPTGSALPQQPIHFSLFPDACLYSSFHSVTNPYNCCVDGVNILATSGQNLDDIFRCIDSESRLDMMEQMLNWGHFAPTAPDTLWCFPYKEKDPFILKSRPHVFIIGNQPKFETRLVIGPNKEKTQIILVPSFSESGTLILLNLKNLDAECVGFKAPS